MRDFLEQLQQAHMLRGNPRTQKRSGSSQGLVESLNFPRTGMREPSAIKSCENSRKSINLRFPLPPRSSLGRRNLLLSSIAGIRAKTAHRRNRSGTEQGNINERPITKHQLERATSPPPRSTHPHSTLHAAGELFSRAVTPRIALQFPGFGYPCSSCAPIIGGGSGGIG